MNQTMSRFRESRQPDAPQNYAESLVEIGRHVRKQVRRGVGLGEASRRLQSSPDYCLLALAFVGSSDLLKLRALVEDWPHERIVEELD